MDFRLKMQEFNVSKSSIEVFYWEAKMDNLLFGPLTNTKNKNIPINFRDNLIV